MQHVYFFYLGDICPIEHELVKKKTWADKTYFKAVSKQKPNLKKNSFIFKLNCKANAEKLKWNFNFIWSIHWKSACPVVLICIS